MNPFEYEELAWERIRELRSEAESFRAAGKPHRALARIRLLAEQAWLLAGLASQRAPRYRSRTAASALALWRLRSPNR